MGEDERPEDSSDVLELPVGEQVRVVRHVRANSHLRTHWFDTGRIVVGNFRKNHSNLCI